MIEIGAVYKKFACGCIVTVKTPVCRAFHPTLKTKAGNRLTVTCCPEHQVMDAHYEYSFKICPVCRQLVWAKKGRLRPGRCQVCGRKAWLESYVPGNSKHRNIRYYQHGHRIQEPSKLVTEHMCRHRIECLPDDNDGALHCGGCEYFEPEVIRDVPVNWCNEPYMYAEV